MSSDLTNSIMGALALLSVIGPIIARYLPMLPKPVRSIVKKLTTARIYEGILKYDRIKDMPHDAKMMALAGELTAYYKKHPEWGEVSTSTMLLIVNWFYWIYKRFHK